MAVAVCLRYDRHDRFLHTFFIIYLLKQYLQVKTDQYAGEFSSGTEQRMTTEEQKNREADKNEKIGRTIWGISYFFFAVKFIVVISLISLAVLYLIRKPLWIAPVIALAAFLLYRLCWRLIFWLIRKSSEH